MMQVMRTARGGGIINRLWKAMVMVVMVVKVVMVSVMRMVVKVIVMRKVVMLVVMLVVMAMVVMVIVMRKVVMRMVVIVRNHEEACLFASPVLTTPQSLTTTHQRLVSNSLCVAPMPSELVKQQQELDRLGGGDTRLAATFAVCRLCAGQRPGANAQEPPGAAPSNDSPHEVVVRDARLPLHAPASAATRSYKGFEAVVNAHASHRDLWNDMGTHALQWVLDGFSACIVAHGAVATGKTHALYDRPTGLASAALASVGAADRYVRATPTGPGTNCGLVVRFLAKLFANVGKPAVDRGDVRVGLSAWELVGGANSPVDLLAPADTTPGAGGTDWTTIQAATKHPPTPHLGRTAHTRSFESSCRNTARQTLAALHVVDLVGTHPLAGVRDSMAQPDASAPLLAASSSPHPLGGSFGRETERERREVGKHLLALSRVVTELASLQVGSGPNAAEERTRRLVSARDAKLTQMLGPLMAGNARLFWLSCVSAAPSDALDAAGTLRIATRAARIPCACVRVAGIPAEAVEMLPAAGVLDFGQTVDAYRSPPPPSAEAVQHYTQPEASRAAYAHPMPLQHVGESGAMLPPRPRLMQPDALPPPLPGTPKMADGPPTPPPPPLQPPGTDALGTQLTRLKEEFKEIYDDVMNGNRVTAQPSPPPDPNWNLEQVGMVAHAHSWGAMEDAAAARVPPSPPRQTVHSYAAAAAAAAAAETQPRPTEGASTSEEMEELRCNYESVLVILGRERRAADSLQRENDDEKRELQERLGAVELDLDNARLENVNLRSKLKAHEQRLPMDALMERYEAEVERYSRENERLKAEVKSLAARLESGDGQADEPFDEISSQPDSETAPLRGGRQLGLRRQLKRAETERDALAAEAADLRKQLRKHDAMRKAAEEGREKINKLQRENDSLVAEVEKWRLRDAEAEGELSRRDAEHMSDRRRAETAEDECEDLRMRVVSLREQLRDARLEHRKGSLYRATLQAATPASASTTGVRPSTSSATRKRAASSAIRAAPSRLSLRKSPRPAADDDVVDGSMASVQDILDAAMDRAEAQGAFRRQREVELKALLTQYASNECADDDGVADGFV
ncbi:kinesin motor domain-containing protein [Pycnococcus provasolii]